MKSEVAILKCEMSWRLVSIFMLSDRASFRENWTAVRLVREVFHLARIYFALWRNEDDLNIKDFTLISVHV